MKNVLVVGSGLSGLTCAIKLAEQLATADAQAAKAANDGLAYYM